MYVEPIECPTCGRRGRPGEAGFQVDSTRQHFRVHCDCGEVFEVESPCDQCILSTNPFSRLSAASNHCEHGQVTMVPGGTAEVSFQKPFDFACRAFLTPQGMPIVVKELNLTSDGMTILSSFLKDEPTVAEATVNWLVYGLTDVDDLPTWYVHFYGAIGHLENGLHKSALLDYAVAFESFIESFLAEHLSRRYGKAVSEYLLHRTWRVQERCNALLELAVEHRLSERSDVYQPWDEHVREPRNALVHGEVRPIGRENAEKAHQAVYQAIRWVEDIAQQGAV